MLVFSHILVGILSVVTFVSDRIEILSLNSGGLRSQQWRRRQMESRVRVVFRMLWCRVSGFS